MYTLFCYMHLFISECQFECYCVGHNFSSGMLLKESINFLC
uniref:Uncharacterized protein n=1 Tax=Setaria viridis TaxID=4556 RepID=A0A4V6D8D6_SETVI|nr:hypothetical protein SEVIR_4G138701v2 [Setaria viridis]